MWISKERWSQLQYELDGYRSRISRLENVNEVKSFVPMPIRYSLNETEVNLLRQELKCFKQLFMDYLGVELTDPEVIPAKLVKKRTPK